jgi:hypothetical protein
VTQSAPPIPASPPARPPFLDAFARILLELRMCVGDRMKAAPALMPLALALLIDGRLHRLSRRFFALAEKALAGTLRPPRARLPRMGNARMGNARMGEAEAGDAAPAASARPRPLDALPRVAGWMLRLCPPIWRTWVPGPMVIGCRFKLDQLVESDAAFRALIASDARFGRVLRPLMHMISPDPLPDWLALPPRPDQARGARAAPGRPRRRRARAAGSAAHPVVQNAPPPTLPPPNPPPADPPPAAPLPNPPLPYALVPDWTPTELTRSPRPARNRYVTGPPMVFRSLW